MESVDKQEEQEAKKSYQSPELVVYGDIGKITQAMSSGAMAADGGGGGLDKT